MKNLSITIIFLSSLMFGTNAFAKTKTRTTKVVKTKRTIKNVRPNRKVVKVKTVKVVPKKKHYKRTKRRKNYKPVKSHKVYKRTKYYHGPRKVVRHGRHFRHNSHHYVGHLYSSLPPRAVRVVRHGRIVFFAENAFFRPVYKYGRPYYRVVK